MDLSILDDFQVVQSPVSVRRLDFDEFTYASTPMQSSYCHQMTEEEYQTMGETETEKALQELISHMEQNPECVRKVLRKRRVEEVENAGIFSMLKCRLMTKLKGSEYIDSLLSKEECEKRLQELSSGMVVVHNYSKETRRSSRLAEQRLKTASGSDATGTAAGLCRRGIHEDRVPQAPAPPPPLPPPPLPSSHSGTTRNILPLKERNVNVANEDSDTMTKIKVKKSAVQKTGSSSTANSLFQELMECDPVKRLRSTQVPRSPGGTPAINPSKAPISQSTESLSWSNPLDTPEPLHAAMLRLLNEKFRNVRSPSPAHCGPDAASPQAFSP